MCACFCSGFVRRCFPGYSPSSSIFHPCLANVIRVVDAYNPKDKPRLDAHVVCSTHMRDTWRVESPRFPPNGPDCRWSIETAVPFVLCVGFSLVPIQACMHTDQFVIDVNSRARDFGVFYGWGNGESAWCLSLPNSHHLTSRVLWIDYIRRVKRSNIFSALATLRLIFRE